MTRAELQTAVVSALTEVAPEVEASRLRPDVPLRDQTDLDSVDFLRFVVEVHRRCGVDIPESDYAHLQTLTRAVDYLARRLGSAP